MSDVKHTNADDIISKIIEDIRDRSGLGNEWENIDVDIRNEIVAKWRTFFPASVIVSESVHRDAERYRWLRLHCKFANDSMREIWFNREIQHSALKGESASDLDRAIDEEVSGVQR